MSYDGLRHHVKYKYWMVQNVTKLKFEHFPQKKCIIKWVCTGCRHYLEYNFCHTFRNSSHVYGVFIEIRSKDTKKTENKQTNSSKMKQSVKPCE